MRCIVTGSAGFIGSHLCEDLLRRGHTVVGIDSFLPNYSPALKADNHSALLAHPRYRFHALDLRRDALDEAVADADVVFHLAALSGLPRSWTDFDGYLSCNVLATQRLLNAVRSAAPGLRRFVFASTASVYGRVALGDESSPTQPVSPYGVTKLAAEQLCRVHADAFRLAVVVLRYFSVYGPRQRPDMAYHRFIRALLHGLPIEVYGDGQQVRGGTFVADCVEATVAAVEAPAGETYNIGGGERTSVLEVIRTLEAVAGRSAEVVFKPARVGDQRQTFADTTKIRNHLGWRPRTRLADGLARQWLWQAAQADSPVLEPLAVAT